MNKIFITQQVYSKKTELKPDLDLTASPVIRQDQSPMLLEMIR